MDLSAYPDADQVVMDLLGDLVGNPDDIGTVIPADLQTRLTADPPRPVIRVRRIGGNDNKFIDFPRVDVQMFASTRAAAQPLAERARQRLVSGPSATAHGVIDRAETEVGPTEIPYPDPDVRMFSATYRLSLRRRT